MKVNLGQLIPEEPDPGLVLPGISPFQLLPQLSGVADLSIEFAMGTIEKTAQQTAGLGSPCLPLSITSAFSADFFALAAVVALLAVLVAVLDSLEACSGRVDLPHTMSR